MPGRSLEDLTTDELLETARRTAGSHELLSTLLADPVARPAIQREMKRLNPKLVIPEIDAVDTVTAEIKKRDDEIAALRKEIMTDRVTARIKEQREGLKSKYHLNDDDLIEVEKLMTAETDPIPSYDAAARVFIASKKSALPTTTEFNPPTFEMPEKDVWGGGIGNPAMLNKIATNEAYAALNDIMQGKVAGLGPAFGPGR